MAPRIMQKKIKRTINGQEVLIPIYNLSPKEVIIYFRFWDSISNKLLFTFEHYTHRKLSLIKNEEDNLRIYYNKKYTTD